MRSRITLVFACVFVVMLFVHDEHVVAAAGDGSLAKPIWQVGDRWVVETVTERFQARDADDDKTKPIQWRFEVAKLERISDRECYRIEVECLAKGRMRPRTTLWCDRQTLFLRQVRTQLLFAGKYRDVFESYRPATGMQGAVLTSINALPVDLPAFLPGVRSKGADNFVVRNQPSAAGSKDLSLLTFAQNIGQDIGAPRSKTLQSLPVSFSKSLEKKGVTEVRLIGHQKFVTQLWEQGQPWPVYTSNGRTKSRLISVKRNQDR